MSLSKIFKVTASAEGNDTSVITGSFDSTGYTHVVVFTKHEGTTANLTVTDNKSSTFSNLTKVDHTNGDLTCQMAWAPIGSPGTGHVVTMTLNLARPYKRIGVWLVNATGGTLELDVQSTAQGSSSSPDAGSLATTAATVSFMGVGEYGGVTYTPGTGWTEDWDTLFFGQSRADASGTLDPASTCSGSMDWVACSASFKEPAGGPTTVTGADTVKVGLSEDRTLLVSMTREDSMRAGLTEDRSILARLTREDSLSLVLSDLSSLLSNQNVSDSLAAALAESSGLTALLRADDAIVVALSEDRSILVALSRDESLLAGLSETVSILATLVREDTPAIILVESSSLSTQDMDSTLVSKTGADSLTLGLVDAYLALLGTLSREDTVRTVIAENDVSGMTEPFFPMTGLGNLERGDAGDQNNIPGEKVFSFDGGIDIVGGQLRANTSTNRGSYVFGKSVGPDCELHTRVATWTDPCTVDLVLRTLNPGSAVYTMYGFQFSNVGGTVTVNGWRYIGGAATQLTGSTTFSANDGDRIGCNAHGTTLRAYLMAAGSSEWVELISWSDSNISGVGQIGYRIDNALSPGVRLDDVGGGTASLGASVLARLTREESQALGVSDAGTVAVSITATTDTLGITIAETAQQVVSVVGADAVQIVVNESASIFARLDRGDDLYMALSDVVGAIIATLNREDVTGTVIVDSSQILVPVTGTDAVVLGTTESGSAIEVFLNRIGSVLIATVKRLSQQKTVRYVSGIRKVEVL